MARSVNEIAGTITNKLRYNFSLSSSQVAEWRLWVSVCAIAIYTFELILDQFKSEVSSLVMTSRPGTRKWYEQLCLAFQNGHELRYNNATGALYYDVDDPDARITAVAAIGEKNGLITIRVAKSQGEDLAPFSEMELLNFNNYLSESKPLGSKIRTLSTTPDQVLYDAQVYYDPSYPVDTVKSRVEESLAVYQRSQQFGGMLYPARFSDAIIDSEGVVTVCINKFAHKGISDPDYSSVELATSLEAGYFNFDPNSIVQYIPANEL